MSKKENYESKTEALLLPIAEKNHVEIYDVEYVKGIFGHILTGRAASATRTMRL